MKNSTNLFLQETLNKERLDLLPKISFLKEKGFYLVGGTALALQYGHRQSVDFDFFVENDINTEKLYTDISNKLIDCSVKKDFEEENTLYVQINGIKFSFFTYEHKLLYPLLETEFLNLASKIDIACMKLWAIQNRATNKDYIDMYFLLHEFSLEDIIKSFYKKFGKVINENFLLKSLTYFEDIQYEPLTLNTDISFEEVKKFLIEKVKKY